MLRVANKVETAPAVVAAIGARRVLRVGNIVEAALAVVVAIGTNTVHNMVAIGTIGKVLNVLWFLQVTPPSQKPTESRSILGSDAVR